MSKKGKKIVLGEGEWLLEVKNITRRKLSVKCNKRALVETFPISDE
jgi:hypothetical protein